MSWVKVPARRCALLLIAGAALAYAGLAMAVARRSGVTSTYAGHSLALAWCFAVAGLAMFGAGLATVAVHRRPRLGVLAIVAGVLWFGPLWGGWLAGPELVRTLGMLAAGLVLPVLVHLVLAAASHPLTTTAASLVVATYVIVGLGTLAVMLVRDPYYDPYCWSNCTANVLELSSEPALARRLERIHSWSTIVLAATFALLCSVWLVQGLRAPARRHWEVLPGGLVLSAATITHELLLRRHPLEDPSVVSFAAAFAVRCAAAMLIAAGLVAILVHARLQRGSVGRIITTLDRAPPVGGLEAALANSLGDPTLRIYYWLPTEGHFAAAQGQRLADPAPKGDVITTPLVRGGQTVAVVTHRSDPADLERALGSAARLALDNERLQAEVRARMHDLTASRARIVEAADARRRALERDLHDGAQQSLLGMSYDLQVAKSAAAASGNTELSALVDAAADEVRTAFGELRELAHGIYPAVLDAAGLCPAITALHSSSPVAIDIDPNVEGRLPPVVERTAYLVVASAVEAATASDDGPTVHIFLARRDGALAIDIAHDGSDLAINLEHLDDRVGAAGGRLVVTPNRITAELPCESLSPTT